MSYEHDILQVVPLLEWHGYERAFEVSATYPRNPYTTEVCVFITFDNQPDAEMFVLVHQGMTLEQFLQATQS